MAVNIKPIIEKPVWFDLSNYENSQNAEIDQWIYNLSDRVFILNKISEIEKKDKEYPDNGIMERGLGDLRKDISYENTGFFDFNLDDENVEQHFFSTIQNTIRSFRSHDIPSFIDQLTRKEKNIFEYYESNVDIYATVNINAPLDKMMKDFKVWVLEQKKKNKIDRKSITDEDIRIWRDNRVIQYMDLFIWMKIEEIEIKDDQISGWIFPEIHITSIDKFRDGTKPLFKKMASEKYLEYLAVQNRENYKKRGISAKEYT